MMGHPINAHLNAIYFLLKRYRIKLGPGRGGQTHPGHMTLLGSRAIQGEGRTEQIETAVYKVRLPSSLET